MPATLNECRGAGEQYGFHACAHPSTRVIKTKAGQRLHKDPERKAKSRQVGKEKGEYKEQLRRCRSEVTLHTAFIRNLKWKTKTLGGPELRRWEGGPGPHVQRLRAAAAVEDAGGLDQTTFSL